MAEHTRVSAYSGRVSARIPAPADAVLPRTIAYLYDYTNFAHPFRYL
jgi:hypothetical protein